MTNMKGRIKRALTFILSAALLLTSVNLNVISARADVSDTSTGDSTYEGPESGKEFGDDITPSKADEEGFVYITPDNIMSVCSVSENTLKPGIDYGEKMGVGDAVSITFGNAEEYEKDADYENFFGTETFETPTLAWAFRGGAYNKKSDFDYWKDGLYHKATKVTKKINVEEPAAYGQYLTFDVKKDCVIRLKVDGYVEKLSYALAEYKPTVNGYECTYSEKRSFREIVLIAKAGCKYQLFNTRAAYNIIQGYGDSVLEIKKYGGSLNLAEIAIRKLEDRKAWSEVSNPAIDILEQSITEYEDEEGNLQSVYSESNNELSVIISLPQDVSLYDYDYYEVCLYDGATDECVDSIIVKNLKEYSSNWFVPKASGNYYAKVYGCRYEETEKKESEKTSNTDFVKPVTIPYVYAIENVGNSAGGALKIVFEKQYEAESYVFSMYDTYIDVEDEEGNCHFKCLNSIEVSQDEINDANSDEYETTAELSSYTWNNLPFIPYTTDEDNRYLLMISVKSEHDNVMSTSSDDGYFSEISKGSYRVEADESFDGTDYQIDEHYGSATGKYRSGSKVFGTVTPNDKTKAIKLVKYTYTVDGEEVTEEARLNGAGDSEATEFSFIMPEANVTLSVEMADGYSISVEEDYEWIIYAMPKASEGQKVLVSWNPIYKINKLYCADEAGHEIDIVRNADNDFEFTMPAANIKISGSIERKYALYKPNDWGYFNLEYKLDDNSEIYIPDSYSEYGEYIFIPKGEKLKYKPTPSRNAIEEGYSENSEIVVYYYSEEGKDIESSKEFLYPDEEGYYEIDPKAMFGDVDEELDLPYVYTEFAYKFRVKAEKMPGIKSIGVKLPMDEEVSESIYTKIGDYFDVVYEVEDGVEVETVAINYDANPCSSGNGFKAEKIEGENRYRVRVEEWFDTDCLRAYVTFKEVNGTIDDSTGILSEGFNYKYYINGGLEWSSNDKFIPYQTVYLYDGINATKVYINYKKDGSDIKEECKHIVVEGDGHWVFTVPTVDFTLSFAPATDTTKYKVVTKWTDEYATFAGMDVDVVSEQYTIYNAFYMKTNDYNAVGIKLDTEDAYDKIKEAAPDKIIEIEKNEDGFFSFKMPAYDVTVITKDKTNPLVYIENWYEEYNEKLDDYIPHRYEFDIIEKPTYNGYNAYYPYVPYDKNTTIKVVSKAKTGYKFCLMDEEGGCVKTPVYANDDGVITFNASLFDENIKDALHLYLKEVQCYSIETIKGDGVKNILTSIKSAAKGEPVKVSVEPEEGYLLDKVIVTAGTGSTDSSSEIQVRALAEEGNMNCVEFVMPNTSVYVNAIMKKDESYKPSEPTDPTPGEPVDPTPGEPVDPTPGEPVDPTPSEPVSPEVDEDKVSDVGSDKVEVDNTYDAVETFTRKEFNERNVEIAVKDVTYTGEFQRPAVKVSFIENGKKTVLIEGTDYVLSYENNKLASTRDEKAIVKIEGSGLYKGQKIQNFIVAPMSAKKLKYVADTVVAKSEKTELNEKIAIYDGLTLLEEGKDYTLDTSATNLDKKGNATVIANAIGNYDGELTIKVPVVELKSDEKLITSAELKAGVSENLIYTGKAIKFTADQVVVKAGDEEITDFSISAKNTKDVGEGYLIIKGKKKVKGTVIIPVTILSPKTTLKVEPIKNADKIIYNGKLQRPKVVVKDANGKSLKLNKDYKVTYENNLNATGSENAIVKVTGIGNYENAIADRDVTFTIKPLEIKKAKVVITKKVFDRVEYNKHPLVEGVDYKRDTEEVKGKVKIKITGLRNFTGTVVK